MTPRRFELFTVILIVAIFILKESDTNIFFRCLQYTRIIIFSLRSLRSIYQENEAIKILKIDLESVQFWSERNKIETRSTISIAYFILICFQTQNIPSPCIALHYSYFGPVKTYYVFTCYFILCMVVLFFYFIIFKTIHNT